MIDNFLSIPDADSESLPLYRMEFKLACVCESHLIIDPHWVSRQWANDLQLTCWTIPSKLCGDFAFWRGLSVYRKCYRLPVSPFNGYMLLLILCLIGATMSRRARTYMMHDGLSTDIVLLLQSTELRPRIIQESTTIEIIIFNLEADSLSVNSSSHERAGRVIFFCMLCGARRDSSCGIGPGLSQSAWRSRIRTGETDA